MMKNKIIFKRRFNQKIKFKLVLKIIIMKYWKIRMKNRFKLIKIPNQIKIFNKIMCLQLNLFKNAIKLKIQIKINR